MQAQSRWLHAIRKGVITKKTWRKKYENTQLFFEVRNLRKYPIDPKAYLGRWVSPVNLGRVGLP